MPVSELCRASDWSCILYRQLVFKVEEIHTTLRKHLAKEEEQLFPLLLEHFTYAEQVGDVDQQLCQLDNAALIAALSSFSLRATSSECQNPE